MTPQVTAPDSERRSDPVSKRSPCSLATLDNCWHRRAIADALQGVLPQLRGTLLDVGCGNMPYRGLVTAAPSQVDRYVGLDLRADEKDGYIARPDLEWDGSRIPLVDESVHSVLATELLEHCPAPELVVDEMFRVLAPGGVLFLTVPFLWPLHDAPHDEYRFTPYAIERMLGEAGFSEIGIRRFGGWDLSLAQMIGLWVRRRPMRASLRSVLSLLAMPLVSLLAHSDNPEADPDNAMITGLSATARKPAAQ